MNELPEARKAIHGISHHEVFDHARSSAAIDGPYKHHHATRLILLAVVTIIILVIVGLLHD
jgi:hypothetical protein